MDETINNSVNAGNIPAAPVPPAMGGTRVDQGGAPAGVTMDNQGRTAAPDFLNAIRRTALATAMSSRGMEYVKNLKAAIAEKGGNRFEVRTLSYPPESLAIISGNVGICLLFSEAIRRDDNLPVSAMTRNVLTTFNEQVGTKVRMVNTIVVTPADYDRAAVMAAHIINALNSLTEAAISNMDIRSLQNFPLEISTNPDTYDNFNAKYNPHGVAARADITLTISASIPRKNTRGDANLFSQAEIDTKIDVASIGAYTIFSATNDNGVLKYQPEIHISEITSPIMTEGMIPLLLSLATDCLITNQFWKFQFSDLGGQHHPNIGNLVNDTATGQPWRATNLQERDEFIKRNCTPPILFLDVVEGRARIPGLERYSLPEWYPHIIDDYNRFLCAAEGSPEFTPRSAAPGLISWREYLGTFQSGSELMDSRWVDFLSVMVHRSTERVSCERLLNHQEHEQDQVNVVRDFAPNLNLLYVNTVVALHPEVIRNVQAAVHKVVRTLNGNVTTGVVDMSSLASMGRGFIATPTNTFYNNQFASFSPIYGMPNGSSLF